MADGWPRVICALMLTVVQAASIPAIGEPDVLANVTDTDLAVIKERARGACDSLWLVKVFRSQLADSQYVEAYCAAVPTQHETVWLRRGAYVAVRTQPAEPWTVSHTGQYAQVGTEAPDQIPGDRDIRRPFRVMGAFSDQDLLSLVAYIRSSPPNPRNDRYLARVEGSWPFTRVARNPDGTIDVGLARDDMSAQRVRLRQTDRGWEIVEIGFVVA